MSQAFCQKRLLLQQKLQGKFEDIKASNNLNCSSNSNTIADDDDSPFGKNLISGEFNPRMDKNIGGRCQDFKSSHQTLNSKGSSKNTDTGPFVSSNTGNFVKKNNLNAHTTPANKFNGVGLEKFTSTMTFGGLRNEHKEKFSSCHDLRTRCDLPKWFFTNLSRDGSEAILTLGKEFGNVLMRNSTSYDGNHVVSARYDCKGVTEIRHYEVTSIAIDSGEKRYILRVIGQHPMLESLEAIFNYFLKINPGMKPLHQGMVKNISWTELLNFTSTSSSSNNRSWITNQFHKNGDVSRKCDNNPVEMNNFVASIKNNQFWPFQGSTPAGLKVGSNGHCKDFIGEQDFNKPFNSSSDLWNHETEYNHNRKKFLQSNNADDRIKNFCGRSSRANEAAGRSMKGGPTFGRCSENRLVRTTSENKRCDTTKTSGPPAAPPLHRMTSSANSSEDSDGIIITPHLLKPSLFRGGKGSLKTIIRNNLNGGESLSLPKWNNTTASSSTTKSQKGTEQVKETAGIIKSDDVDSDKKCLSVIEATAPQTQGDSDKGVIINVNSLSPLPIASDSRKSPVLAVKPENERVGKHISDSGGGNSNIDEKKEFVVCAPDVNSPRRYRKKNEIPMASVGTKIVVIDGVEECATSNEMLIKHKSQLKKVENRKDIYGSCQVPQSAQNGGDRSSTPLGSDRGRRVEGESLNLKQDPTPDINDCGSDNEECIHQQSLNSTNSSLTNNEEHVKTIQQSLMSELVSIMKTRTLDIKGSGNHGNNNKNAHNSTTNQHTKMDASTSHHRNTCHQHQDKGTFSKCNTMKDKKRCALHEINQHDAVDKL